MRIARVAEIVLEAEPIVRPGFFVAILATARRARARAVRTDDIAENDLAWYSIIILSAGPSKLAPRVWTWRTTPSYK